MTDTSLPEEDPERGSFALCLLNSGDGRVTYLRGWPAAKWWASPMLFWDDFSNDGQLGPEAAERKLTGALCLQRDIKPGSEAEYTFLLAWHFPNRTPAWSGWTAPKGHENAIIGNHYCTRFADAWSAAQHAAQKLPDLEKRMMTFVSAMRSQHAAGRGARRRHVKSVHTRDTDFVSAPPMASFTASKGATTSAAVASETARTCGTMKRRRQFLFPASRAVSAESVVWILAWTTQGAHAISADAAGWDRSFRDLPRLMARWARSSKRISIGGCAAIRTGCAATGPRLSVRWISFAWIKGGWDANRDGVMEGVQHNTYDVEFYGPNPLCGIYYLGALRAAEEMARALGDSSRRAGVSGLFERAARWVDSNLFNGEYYIQKFAGHSERPDCSAPPWRHGSRRSGTPEFQVGDGCLVDQLIGQYLADMAGLGPSARSSEHSQDPAARSTTTTTAAICSNHDSVQRIFALNDEAAHPDLRLR